MAVAREERWIDSEPMRFGPKWEEAFLPLDQINVCGQMRAVFEPEPLQALAKSIRSEGQLHPLLVMSMDEDLARRYVGYTNECWGTSIEFEDFAPSSDGSYHILAAGERRLRAMRMNEDEDGVRPGTYGADCKVRRPKNIVEVLKAQFDENLHERPAPQQYAKSIYQAYYIGKQEGVFRDVASFVRFSSLPEESTRDILRYFELPIQIHEMVEKGAISYSIAIELVPLLKAAYQYYRKEVVEREVEAAGSPHLTEEDVRARAMDLVYTEAIYVSNKLHGYDTRNLENTKKWNRDKVRDYVQDLVKRMAKPDESAMQMILKDEKTTEIAVYHERKSRRKEILRREADTLAQRLAALKHLGVEVDTSLLPGHGVAMEVQTELHI